MSLKHRSYQHLYLLVMCVSVMYKHTYNYLYCSLSILNPMYEVLLIVYGSGSLFFFFFSSRRRHTRCSRDWSSDVCSSDLARRRVRLRRADPGSRPYRLAPADGTGADDRRGDPPRGTGPAAGGGGRVKVVILFDPGAEDWTPEDIRGVMKAVDEIGAIFASMGHEIRKVGVRHDMRWFQVARRADLVFNLCEGVHGKSEWEEHVVGTLEFAGIPITGASLWTLAACRRKPIANALLQQAGLAIPRWTRAQGKIEDDFPLPAIVKPAAEDASARLDRGSVVSDRKSLRARLAAMTEQFDEVLVQEYIGGRRVKVRLRG